MDHSPINVSNVLSKIKVCLIYSLVPHPKFPSYHVSMYSDHYDSDYYLLIVPSYFLVFSIAILVMIVPSLMHIYLSITSFRRKPRLVDRRLSRARLHGLRGQQELRRGPRRRGKGGGFHAK